MVIYEELLQEAIKRLNKLKSEMGLEELEKHFPEDYLKLVNDKQKKKKPRYSIGKIKTIIWRTDVKWRTKKKPNTGFWAAML